LLEVCIEAKDSSNNLVAGSVRNLSQESWNKRKKVMQGKDND